MKKKINDEWCINLGFSIALLIKDIKNITFDKRFDRLTDEEQKSLMVSLILNHFDIKNYDYIPIIIKFIGDLADETIRALTDERKNIR